MRTRPPAGRPSQRRSANVRLPIATSGASAWSAAVTPPGSTQQRGRCAAGAPPRSPGSRTPRPAPPRGPAAVRRGPSALDPGVPQGGPAAGTTSSAAPRGRRPPTSPRRRPACPRARRRRSVGCWRRGTTTRAARRRPSCTCRGWPTRFRRDPDLVGSTARLGPQSFTVVGVTANPFPGPAHDPDLRALKRRPELAWRQGAGAEFALR